MAISEGAVKLFICISVFTQGPYTAYPTGSVLPKGQTMS